MLKCEAFLTLEIAELYLTEPFLQNVVTDLWVHKLQFKELKGLIIYTE
jgi:hypothetical protein